MWSGPQPPKSVPGTTATPVSSSNAFVNFTESVICVPAGDVLPK